MRNAELDNKNKRNIAWYRLLDIIAIKLVRNFEVGKTENQLALPSSDIITVKCVKNVKTV